MNQPRDPDALIATWLDDGPIDLPDETRRAISVGLRTQPRARRMAILRGLPMFAFNRFATAAAIVLAVGAISVLALANRGGGPGSLPSTLAPSASPAAVPSPSHSATASFGTAGWVKFSSGRYGYAISLPADWTAQQSDRQWSLAVDQKDWLTTAADTFIGPGGPGIGSRGPRFTVFAVDLPAGTSSNAWIASYYGSDAKGSPDPCTHRPVDLGTKQIDGHAVAIWTEVSTTDCGGTAAFVFINSRAYVFSIWLDGQEPVFEALLSTVTFQP